MIESLAYCAGIFPAAGLRDSFIDAGLFPDAEFTEDIFQQIIGCDRPGNLSQIVQRLTNIKVQSFSKNLIKRYVNVAVLGRSNQQEFPDRVSRD